MGQNLAWQSVESSGWSKTSLLAWHWFCPSAVLGPNQLLSTLEHPEERLLHEAAQQQNMCAQSSLPAGPLQCLTSAWKASGSCGNVDQILPALFHRQSRWLLGCFALWTRSHDDHLIDSLSSRSQRMSNSWEGNTDRFPV